MTTKYITAQNAAVAAGAMDGVILAATQVNIDANIESEQWTALALRLEGSEAYTVKTIEIRRKGAPKQKVMLALDVEHELSLATVNAMLGPDGNGLPLHPNFVTRQGLEVLITGTNPGDGADVITAALSVANPALPPGALEALSGVARRLEAGGGAGFDRVNALLKDGDARDIKV